ncbi:MULTISPECIES: RagB/SusD family nutrient uptake outer membrane protein [Robiginitalea]|uniref:Putative outer membrane protein, probably involved in nutrient binding n=1 Tax=Robiginitalea biformata (strain ATCC BAA-864 / DSM 15991 / KCTC 12146 / HTCC2501) TaxID=313596 RepID=A4CNX3_ROBBH|nr:MULTISPECIES: RagB/SusD family nutrient uptake outer membrane protein [Robiginitalea]EAR14590.1 putative outer membrane protein, probably involved in nutrient binding [Robiginitalea biformata HTCC2501]MDC6354928.1 RagB/SusD family nutrient uptake outer membrane protein [Robiginitalea sp. PM2]MDC6375194.1 RagB/SusD family nutrient uptake outer membrane protein [Robiginitalea sp. SP8]
MKKYIYSSLLLAGLLTGCGEDFLELPPEDSLSQAIFFETQSDFEQAINATYAPLRDLYSDAYIMGEMRSDNTHYRHNPNYRAVQSEENVANFLVQSPNAFVETKYDNNYLIIARANQILAEIDAVEFDDPGVKSNVIGQALFLRAHSYFDLARYYGSVPLHLTPVTNREEAALPLSSRSEILAQVVSDLDEAIGLLPVKANQEAGRATRGSAQMLLANLYMVEENWSAASSLLTDLVNSGQYNLLGDYASVFDINNKNNAESIFEVQYLEGTEGFASSFMYEWLPMPLTADQVAQISGVSNSQAATIEGFNIPTPDYIQSREASDARTSVNLDSIELEGTFYPYIKKFWQPHSNPGLTGVNWPVYRYAEALLFLAEALNEQGQPGQAEQYLNAVRDRAGLGPITGVDQATMRQAILDERRSELAFENKRWLDLVRTGNAQQVMSDFGARVKANPEAYYYPPGIAPPPASFTTIAETFPLPASEALLNPNF